MAKKTTDPTAGIPITIALTPEAALEVHDRARLAGISPEAWVTARVKSALMRTKPAATKPATSPPEGT